MQTKVWYQYFWLWRLQNLTHMALWQFFKFYYFKFLIKLANITYLPSPSLTLLYFIFNMWSQVAHLAKWNSGPVKYVKLRCDTRFQRAFTACGCVFKVITLFGLNQSNFLKTQPHAVNARWKRMSQRSFSDHCWTAQLQSWWNWIMLFVGKMPFANAWIKTFGEISCGKACRKIKLNLNHYCYDLIMGL